MPSLCYSSVRNIFPGITPEEWKALEKDREEEGEEEAEEEEGKGRVPCRQHCHHNRQPQYQQRQRPCEQTERNADDAEASRCSKKWRKRPRKRSDGVWAKDNWIY